LAKKLSDLSCVHALLNLMIWLLYRPLAICYSMLSLNMADVRGGRFSKRLC